MGARSAKPVKKESTVDSRYHNFFGTKENKPITEVGTNMLDRWVPDEIAYDPYKLYLYNKAIRKGKETEKVLRINIIGNYGQGKTSLARSLIGHTSEGVTSTNGIDISRYICKRSEDGSISANQCDTDSQDIMNRLATIARAMPVTADHENTMQNIDTTSVENRSQRKDIENTEDSKIKSLTANIEQSTDIRKDDNVAQIIYERQPKNEANVIQGIYERQPKKEDSILQTTYERKSQIKVPFSTEEYEIFSDTMEKEEERSEQLLDIWDFGGQYIFYVTHTLFHSKNALYLLVFDLTSPLDKIVRDENFPNETGEKNMAYFAKFWIESIDAYTGPGTQVILIGTHKDKLDNPEQMKDDYFENVRSLFDSLDKTDENQLSSHIQPEDFAVDNSNSPDSGIRELLAFILKKHQELVQTVEIPARWIQLEKALNDEQEKKVVTFQDVMNIDKTIKYSLDDADQVKLFLNYHHDKGKLFYFDDGQPSDPIILDPKFLIDAFKCIITSERFVRKTDARAEWIRLKQEGILSEKLIDTVWAQQEDFKQHKDVLLKFLSKHNILSHVMRSQSRTGSVKGETLYMVPCMLRDFEKTTDILKQFLDKKRQTHIRYLLKFTRPSVVQMVFHKIEAAMFGTWSVVNCCKTKLFFENMGVFEVLETTACKSTNHAAIIECIPECGSIELRLVNLAPGEVRIDVADQLRRYVESFVQVEFRRLTCSYRYNEKPYSRAYRCNHEDHPAGSGSSTIKELNENEEIRCPDNFTHDTDFYSNAKEEWFIEDRDETSYPKLPLTEQHLSLLAQAIGENWQLLGPALGVKQTEMDHINDDYRTAGVKIYHMLLKWKKNDIAEKATLDALVDVVKHCPKVNVEWDAFRNLKDNFDRKSNKAEFIQPLSDKVISLYENLTLQCKLTRSGLPVTWHKNGEAIYPDDHFKISVNGDQQVLTVEKVYHDFAGTYTCICGEAATECVVKVEDPKISLEFIEGLSDADVAYTRSEGEHIAVATFTCILNRNSTDVTWFKREKCIEPSDKYDIVAEGTIRKLKIKNVTEEDEDVYFVKAEGKKAWARLYVEDSEEERILLQEHLLKTQEKAPKDAKTSTSHRLVAAFDIGTAYSGYAYSFSGNPAKIQTNCAWFAGSMACVTIKTPTCVLLSKNKQFHSFGYEAESEYAELDFDGEQDGWMFFRRFKMFLHDSHGLTRSSTIEDINGNSMPAMQIFSMAIAFLKDHLLQTLNSRGFDIDETSILHVITVPAFWNDQATQFMREAAVQAGIDSSNLKLCLEPEAASIWCQNMTTEFKSSLSDVGCLYMVLDIGGDTTDISVLEMKKDGSLKEIHKAIGVPLGGTAVDNNCIEWLTELFGQRAMQRFKDEYMLDYLDFGRELMTKKETISSDTKGKIIFKVPDSLNELYLEVEGSDLKRKVAEMKLTDKVTVSFNKLRLDASIVRSWIEKPINEIIIHVKNILAKENLTPVEKIILVGGLGECELVQETFRAQIQNKTTIVPTEPGLAVLKGAVLFGHL